MTIEQEIINIIAEQLDKDIESINPSDSLMDDLGADELDIVKIFSKIEAKYAISLPDIEGDIKVEDIVRSLSKGTTFAIQEKPRPHHYNFAHRVIPELLFENPDSIINILLESSGQNLLYDLWEQAGSEVSSPKVYPQGLAYTHIQLDSVIDVLVIRLPEPIGRTEAFYSAIVFSFSANSLLRYFTAELTHDDGIVLGEWTDDLKHWTFHNMQDKTIETFINEVYAETNRMLGR